MSAQNCSGCGKTTAEGARFCDQCGTAIEDVTIRRTHEDPELVAIRKALRDRYRIDSLLGRGGMGTVYRAYDPSLDRFVAVKVISRERSREEHFIERFRREARLGARLRHPRIVSIHEVRTVGDIHYFAMDYVEGETLRSVVKQGGPLPAEDAHAIMVEILRAVAHAHSKGIIHRDLKPENVMVDRDGEVFVMDFGLARALQDVSTTDTGAVMGTPLYMSPEQLNGEKLDERTDIFSLGLIFYYCLTGEHLFSANSATGMVSKHLSTNVEDVIAHDARIPEEVKAPLIGMLQRHRDARSDSLQKVLDQLNVRPPAAKRVAPTRATAENEARRGERAEVPAASDAAERRRARLRSLLDKI